MLTESRITNKKCLFCVSDFHLEMILLPYIKEQIDRKEFVILTQDNLEETIKILLEKVNINEKYKNKIKKLNWKNDNDKNKLIKIKDLKNNKKEFSVIINGDCNYIENLKNKINSNIDIITCFHINDSNIDIPNIRKNYDILNTKKIQ